MTGQVARDGVPATVPRIAADDQFLDRTNALEQGDRSFVCVPLSSTGRTLGTLSAFRPVSHPNELAADIERRVRDLEERMNEAANALGHKSDH